jgi:uncharacterized protein Usg
MPKGLAALAPSGCQHTEIIDFLSRRWKESAAASLYLIESNNEGAAQPMSSLSLQLQNYRLTTAEIIYRMPDHPAVLQSYIWQELDLAPDFPMLKKFLDFWTRNIEGKLHAVRVAQAQLVKPAEIHANAHLLRLQ